MTRKILFLYIILLFSINSVQAKPANAIWYFLAKTSTSITENQDISVLYGIYSKYANEGIGEQTGVGGEAPFPTLRVMITNKSNEIIYVDLGTSFIKKNNIASVIYTPSITSTMVGQSFGTSIGLGGIVGAAIGGMTMSASSTSTYAQRFISIPPQGAIFLEDIPILTPGSEKALGNIFYYNIHFLFYCLQCNIIAFY